MNKVEMILLSGMIIFQLWGCHGNQANVQESLADSTSEDSLKRIAPENVKEVSDDSSFFRKPLVACKLIQNPELKVEEDFLNSNIVFFGIRSLPEQRFINEDYCRFVLKNAHFLSIPESNFQPGEFEFSHFYTTIDHYGKCFIGKYYFPAAINAAQRRVTIILQMDTKELSILNFDDVKFVDGKLNCDFNVRGKHLIYKLKYSKECKRFIQFK